MAGPETASGPQAQVILEQRLKDVGYYRSSQPFNPSLPILEESVDGPSILHLRDTHQHNGNVAEHVFVFDPERIEIKIEGIDPDTQDKIRTRTKKLTALKKDEYNLLITHENFVAGWRRVTPDQASK